MLWQPITESHLSISPIHSMPFSIFIRLRLSKILNVTPSAPITPVKAINRINKNIASAHGMRINQLEWLPLYDCRRDKYRC